MIGEGVPGTGDTGDISAAQKMNLGILDVGAAGDGPLFPHGLWNLIEEDESDIALLRQMRAPSNRKTAAAARRQASRPAPPSSSCGARNKRVVPGREPRGPHKCVTIFHPDLHKVKECGFLNIWKIGLKCLWLVLTVVYCAFSSRLDTCHKPG